MGFTDLIQQLRQSASREIIAPSTWTQGRAVFGGLVAGLLYEGMRLELDAERLLRSFSISFVGPVAADVPLRVDVRVLREGRAVTQVQAHGIQNDEVMAVALASFGLARESTLHIEAQEPAPLVAPPESAAERLVKEGLMPQFARFYDLRWSIGGQPFSGTSEREMGGWMRNTDPQPEMAEAQLLGLIDAWPPAVLPMLTGDQLGPVSSLTWAVDFLHPLPALSSTDWLLYRAVVEHARDGYNQAHAHIWSQTGELIALSRQTVAVFV